MSKQITADEADRLAKENWTTRDGRVLAWSEMTVRHLRNTARMVRLGGLDAVTSAYVLASMVQGEMASDSADRLCEDAEDASANASRFATLMEAYADWRTAEVSA